MSNRSASETCHGSHFKKKSSDDAAEHEDLPHVGLLGHLDDPAWLRRVDDVAVSDRHGDVLGCGCGATGKQQVARLNLAGGDAAAVVDLRVRGTGDLLSGDTVGALGQG